MDNEKALMKKDLALILKIDSKMNYNDIENVKKIHDVIIEREMFHTALGTRYIKKLEQIIKEAPNDKCLFCGKQIDNPNKTVLCTDCTAKFIKPTVPKEQSNTSSTTVKDEATPVQLEKKQDDTASTKSPKTKSKKKIIVGAIIIVLVLGILSAIGFGRVFTVLMMVSLVYLIYVCIKKKPKRNAIILFAILFILTGITNMGNTSSDSDDILSYLGTSQEQVFKDYDENLFYSEMNLLTNEDTYTNGKPYITLNSGKVTNVTLTSGMNSKLNVMRIYIGDSKKQVETNMKKNNATVDENSIAGVLETYQIKDGAQRIQVIIKYENGIVTRINCTLAN